MKKHGVRIGLLSVMLVMIAALLCGCASQKASASGKQDDRLVGKWCAEDSEVIRIYYDIGFGTYRSINMQQIEFFDNGKFVFLGKRQLWGI